MCSGCRKRQCAFGRLAPGGIRMKPCFMTREPSPGRVWMPGLVLGSILCGLFLSCAQPPGAQLEAPVSIRVAERVPATGARGQVWNPAPPLSDLRIAVDGFGPGGAGFLAADAGSGNLELSLVSGFWSFEARASDASGGVILTGSAAGRVDPVLGARFSITLAPPSGLGSIDIRYTPPEAAPAEALWRCALSDASGTQVLAWDDAVTTTNRLVEGVSSGYYELSYRLMDGTGGLGGATGIVRVLCGFSTSLSLSCSIPEAGAGLGLVFDAGEPLGTKASLLSRAAVRGFPLRVTATGPAGASYRWSQGGLVLAYGQTVELPTTGLPARGAIDVTVFKGPPAGGAGGGAGGAVAGAASLVFSLEDRPLKAGWSHYASIDAQSDPGSQVIARPAALSASADGRLLGVLSDAASSKLELWKRDPVSRELLPGAAAAIKVGGSARKASELALSPAGDWVAVANSESAWIWLARIHDDGSLGPPSSFSGGQAGLEGLGYVRGLCFSPDSTRLYALSNADRAVYVFGRSGGEWSPVFSLKLDGTPSGTLSVLKDLALSPDGTMLAVAAAGSDALVFLDCTADAVAWGGEARLGAGYARLDYPQVLDFSPDGLSLAVACRDSRALVVFDSATRTSRQVLATAEGLSGVPLALSYKADSSSLAVASTDGLHIAQALAGGALSLVAHFDQADATALVAPCAVAWASGAFMASSVDAASMAMVSRPDGQ